MSDTLFLLVTSVMTHIPWLSESVTNRLVDILILDSMLSEMRRRVVGSWRLIHTICQRATFAASIPPLQQSAPTPCAALALAALTQIASTSDGPVSSSGRGKTSTSGSSVGESSASAFQLILAAAHGTLLSSTGAASSARGKWVALGALDVALAALLDAAVGAAAATPATAAGIFLLPVAVLAIPASYRHPRHRASVAAAPALSADTFQSLAEVLSQAVAQRALPRALLQLAPLLRNEWRGCADLSAAATLLRRERSSRKAASAVTATAASQADSVTGMALQVHPPVGAFRAGAAAAAAKAGAAQGGVGADQPLKDPQRGLYTDIDAFSLAGHAQQQQDRNPQRLRARFGAVLSMMHRFLRAAGAVIRQRAAADSDKAKEQPTVDLVARLLTPSVNSDDVAAIESVTARLFCVILGTPTEAVTFDSLAPLVSCVFALSPQASLSTPPAVLAASPLRLLTALFSSGDAFPSLVVLRAVQVRGGKVGV